MSDQSVSETNSRFLTQHLTDPSWLDVLSAEFEKPYFKKIAGFLWQLKSQGTQVFPPENEIFNAFNLTPFDKVKVVLLGQVKTRIKLFFPQTQTCLLGSIS